MVHESPSYFTQEKTSGLNHVCTHACEGVTVCMTCSGFLACLSHSSWFTPEHLNQCSFFWGAQININQSIECYQTNPFYSGHYKLQSSIIINVMLKDPGFVKIKDLVDFSASCKVLSICWLCMLAHLSFLNQYSWENPQ